MSSWFGGLSITICRSPRTHATTADEISDRQTPGRPCSCEWVRPGIISIGGVSIGGIDLSNKSRIYWDEDEKAHVVEAVFSMRQKDPESSLIAIINRAQQQLPKERRRSIPSVQSVPWVKDAIQNLFAEQREKARVVERTKQSATAAKERQQQLQTQLQELTKKARETALQESSLEDLLIEVIGRITSGQEDLQQRVRKKVYLVHGGISGIISKVEEVVKDLTEA